MLCAPRRRTEPEIKLRSLDPRFMAASRTWLQETGRVLAPFQITRGGPVLMVQVENEYGFYGGDQKYLQTLRDDLRTAGFEVPLFACNPVGRVGVPELPGVFQVVNFPGNPEDAFKRLRSVQKTGPMMCGEFYPGWFDTWGSSHHIGAAASYLKDLEFMLKSNASFSIYMAHGGTSFGLWAGADRPFKPDTSSYDYDAPISEEGRLTDKFRRTRDLFARYLLPGETIPEAPPENPVIQVPEFTLTQSALLFENLPPSVQDREPRTMEMYDQSRGSVLYRTTLTRGPAGLLKVAQVHDFAWVFLDGKKAGVLDRRSRRFQLSLPARDSDMRLDILVEAMGRINFGSEIHDRKGLYGPVELVVGGQSRILENWEVFSFPLENAELESLNWKEEAGTSPGFWRGSLVVEKPGDTFLDLSSWGKGVVWVNRHCLGRFWNIGPTQTMYVPGPWLKAGANEVIVLDLVGPQRNVLRGLDGPILNQCRPELELVPPVPRNKGKLLLDQAEYSQAGSFKPGTGTQDIQFPRPVTGREFCLELLNAQDGRPFAAIAELDLLDETGNFIPHEKWLVTYADSEEFAQEDGSALNAINGQTADFWHTRWSNAQDPFPHYLVLDLGQTTSICGFRYVPRGGGEDLAGRIKDYRVYFGSRLVEEAVK